MTRSKQCQAPIRKIDKTNWHCATPGRRIPTVDRPRSKPRKGAAPQSDETVQKRDGEMEKWRELDGQNRKVINFIGYKPGTGDMIVAKPGYSSSPQPGTGDIIIPNNTINCN